MGVECQHWEDAARVTEGWGRRGEKKQPQQMCGNATREHSALYANCKANKHIKNSRLFSTLLFSTIHIVAGNIVQR